MNFFTRPTTTYNRLKSKERSEERQKVPIINTTNKFTSKFSRLQQPTAFGANKIFRDKSSSELRMPSYESKNKPSTEERSFMNSKRHDEEQKISKSSTQFYKTALRGDALGRKAMNNLKLGNQQNRSDSNNSIRGNRNGFNRNFHGQQNSSINSRNKENEGFKANQINKNLTKSPVASQRKF